MRIKNIKLTLASLVALMGLVCVPGTVAAQPVYVASAAKTSACAAIQQVDPGASCSTGASRLNRIIEVAVNILSSIVGVVAVIMVIASGLKFITAGGDPNKVSSAKSTLIYAIIGLAIVALAQFIVNFVLDKAT